jgi:hypothetical protein
MRYESAVYIASERETMEDQLVRLLAFPAGDMRTEMLTVTRKLVTRLSEKYKKLELAVKHGWSFASKMFDQGEAVEGLTEAQQKTMKNLLKDVEPEKGGGKVSKPEQAKKPYSKDGGGGGDGSFGWGWGGWPQFPQIPPNSYVWNSAAGPASASVFYGHQASQRGGGGGAVSSYGSGGGGSNSGAARKGKIYPCDHCGSYEHWKQSVSCPNFFMYQQQQAERAAAIQRANANNSGGGSIGNAGRASSAAGAPAAGPGFPALLPHFKIFYFYFKFFPIGFTNFFSIIGLWSHRH